MILVILFHDIGFLVAYSESNQQLPNFLRWHALVPI
jgi:hypothetical protein